MDSEANLEEKREGGLRISAAAKMCEMYFEIAVEALGEDEVRKRFRKKLNEEIESLARKTERDGGDDE